MVLNGIKVSFFRIPSKNETVHKIFKQNCNNIKAYSYAHESGREAISEKTSFYELKPKMLHYFPAKI